MPAIELLLSNPMSTLRNLPEPSRRLLLQMNLNYGAITGSEFKRPNLNRGRHKKEK